MNQPARQFECLLALGLVFAGAISARAEYIIDDFRAPANTVVRVITFVNPDRSVVETPDAGILGGERDVLLDVIGTPGLTSFIGEIGDGSFVFGGASPGTAATIQYDGVDADPADALANASGLGPVDLTVHGDRFSLDFLSLDGGGSQFTEIWMTVYSGGASDLLVDLIPDNAGPSTYTSPPFADWVATADPANVTALEFSMNPIGINDVDFELDTIRIVPEPSTLALCVLGLACTLACVWRRRK